MNVTTDYKGRLTGDGDRAMRRFTVLGPLSVVLCSLVFLAGCDKTGLEQAKQEAREAKADVQRLKHSLSLAEKEIAGAKAELNAVRQSRDEQQAKIDRAAQERDVALEFAQKAQEMLKSQSSGQASATAALRQQIAELTARVAEQEKLIDQLQQSTGAGPTDLPPEEVTPEDVPPAEPNEG